MNISIVIPNYNGEHLLEKNLPKVLDSIVGYKKGSIEIIVADDGSSDNSIQVLNTYFPTVKIVTNKINKGFGSNVNSGVRVAKGEIVVLLNTDVVPKKGFLEPLIRHFSDPSVFAVGCLDESFEGKRVVKRGRGLGMWKRGFLVHERGDVDKTNTLWVSCGSGAFRKSIWDTLHGINAVYDPFYWEDIDLSYRALKSGFTISFEPKSVVTHKHAEGTILSNFLPNDIEKVVYRNQFLFVWYNATDPEIIFSHILWLPYHLINAVIAGNSSLLIGFLLASVRFLQHNGRERLVQSFVKGDQEVMQSFHS